VRPLLLDTCTLIFLTEKARLAAAAIEALAETDKTGATTYISPMSAWEIGMLSARGRLQLLIKPERWFANLLEAPNVMLAELTPELLIASSYLPGKPPNDPTDRILAATARDLGAVLVTRDHALLGYGKQGHIAALEC
jgi:PIN domain nuclease of toxin-antitoxin system